jgi:hypothetical protein
VEGTRIMYVGVHEQPPGRNRREKGGSASGQRAASICSVKNSRVGLVTVNRLHKLPAILPFESAS